MQISKEDFKLLKNKLWETLKDRKDVNGIGIGNNFKNWFFCLYVDDNADFDSFPKEYEGYEIKIYLTAKFEFL